LANRELVIRVEVAGVDTVEHSQPKGFDEAQLAYAELELRDGRLRDSERPGGAGLRESGPLSNRCQSLPEAARRRGSIEQNGWAGPWHPGSVASDDRSVHTRLVSDDGTATSSRRT
jgi:hypothetical protein